MHEIDPVEYTWPLIASGRRDDFEHLLIQRLAQDLRANDNFMLLNYLSAKGFV
jgi:hypothetical protein